MSKTVPNFNQQTKVVSLTDAATVTPNCDTTDLGILTSLSQTTTFANPTGTPINGQLLLLRITSSTARTISFGTNYQAASSLTLPNSTTGSSTEDYLAFRYNSTDSKWDLIGTTIGLTAGIVHKYNYLINPNFAVIESTASGTLANSTALPTASLGYLGETGWCIAASGGTPAYSFSSANESVTFTGAASTTAVYLLQRLESKDTNRLKSKTVTFSFETSNSLLTSLTWEIFRPTTSDNTHGTIASPTQTSIGSGTITITSTLTRYSVTVTLPSDASKGLEVRLRVGAQTSGTWVVARLQLEEGSLATAFGCQEYPLELTKCRRYFQYAQYNMFFYAPVAGAVIENWHPFGVQMFAAPVLGAILTDPNSSPAVLNNSTATVLRQTKEGVACSFTGANTGTAYIVGYRASMSSHIP